MLKIPSRSCDPNPSHMTLNYFFFISGHPNVGKSSLINGLMGKKVCTLSLSLSIPIFSFPSLPAGEHLSYSWTHQTLSDHLPHSFYSFVWLSWTGLSIPGQQATAGMYTEHSPSVASIIITCLASITASQIISAKLRCRYFWEKKLHRPHIKNSCSILMSWITINGWLYKTIFLSS